MKILISQDRIIGTAFDTYSGPDFHIPAPDDFRPEYMSEYRYTDGELILPMADIQRTERNTRLAACDWVVLRAAEANEVVPAEWLEYRQALRDVPQQEGFPDNVVWPVAPGY